MAISTSCFVSFQRGGPFLWKSCSPPTTRPWKPSFHSASFAANKRAANKRPAQSVAAQGASPRRPNYHQHFDEDVSPSNLFLDIIQSIFRDVRSGLMFLLEQPGELKYLEFPSLQSAGTMALFTIAVVMVLIVFLATVDSGFSSVVASVFRRIN